MFSCVIHIYVVYNLDFASFSLKKSTMNHDASHPFHDPIRLHAFQSDFPTNVPELYDHFHPFEQEDRVYGFFKTFEH